MSPIAVTKQLLSLADYQARARETLSKVMLDWAVGGPGDPRWETAEDNARAYDRIRLRPRVLVDVSRREMSTTVLGQQISFPLLVAPVGWQQRIHPEGELATARAAAAIGTIMSVSTYSTFSIEEVAQASPGPLWFQLNFYRDRALTRSLVERAEAAGYRAILLTVDAVISGNPRQNALEYAHALEPHRMVHNLALSDPDGAHHWQDWSKAAETSLGWKDVAWLRSITKLPVILKGIQSPEDAALSVEHGIDAIVVSNHGGNGLLGAEPTVEVLGEIVEQVAGRTEVLVDGGVRRGTDILKALAIGARAVLVGAPVNWGLAVGGEQGVLGILEILKRELHIAMGFAGVNDVAEARTIKVVHRR